MILYQELIPLKRNITPQAKATIDSIDRLNDILMDSYETLVSPNNNEDTAVLLSDIRQSIANAKHNIRHILDAISIIGADQRERFFNVEDGKLVETDREHFTGSLDDDTSIAPEV